MGSSEIGDQQGLEQTKTEPSQNGTYSDNADSKQTKVIPRSLSWLNVRIDHLFFQIFYQNSRVQEDNLRQGKFVFILNNAIVHINKMMAPLLNKIPHVFNPPYRPDVRCDAIEHLFSWIKRYIVKEQPLLFGTFQQTFHHALSNVNENLPHFQTNVPSIFSNM
ncbi:unnamed protein product [Paramecium sonneborni]|uniref:Uncharacterized protein n=1 Tax=Paramecium sonneborni TaxID=65129 RepID=A0A8S1RVS9_9CILI|nr:unnamed protein product [Paramecium sonneborni]